MRHLIKSTIEIDDITGEALYWNNEEGWVDKDSATVFLDYEVSEFIPKDSVVITVSE